MIKIIHGEIWSNDFNQLQQLINCYSSCTRFSYNRFKKDKLELNNIRKICKQRYTTLNMRYLYDAILSGQSLFNRFKDKKIIFGGRKYWNEYKSGKISKEQWFHNRNKQLYSRGEKLRGNQNVKIVDEKLRITIGYKKWVYCDLFIPQKFRKELNNILKSGQAYNIRLIRKDNNHFKVIIDYQLLEKIQNIALDNGCIGIDTNPDRIAVCDIAKNGNYINSFSFINNRLIYGNSNKRLYDISIIVKQIVQYAQKVNKGIIFENLKFKKYFEKHKKKSNRIKSNFIYRRFLTLLERKCVENGIEYRKVNPAFTSIIGKLKYKDIYKINIHESAAYVIGRRGLKFKEKLSLKGYNKKELRKQVFRTLEGKYKNRKLNSFELWKNLNDNYKAVLTGLSSNIFNLQKLDDLSVCEFDKLENDSENLSGKIFPLELVMGSKNENSLGIRKDTFKINTN